MDRIAVLSVLFACMSSVVFAGGHLIKDAPPVLRLASGTEVKVLAITRTTLHGSDEEALALQYVTHISMAETEKLYREVEQVWEAFRPLAEREKVRAAAVTANEPSSGLLSVSRGAGWAWKRRADGTWHPPDDDDEARVPK